MGFVIRSPHPLSRAFRGPHQTHPARPALPRAGAGRAAVFVLLVLLVGMLVGVAGAVAYAAGNGGEDDELEAPVSVAGEGAMGSVSVPVTPAVTGPVPLHLGGFTAGVRMPNPRDPASPVTGTAATGEEFTFRVDVPVGSEFVRFDLDSVGDSADLDLNIFLDRPGEESVAWDSQSSASDERVDIPEAPGGSYRIVINAFGGAGDFSFTTYAVPSSSGSGTFTVTPSSLAGEAFVTANVGLSWAGLSWASLPDSTPYLGVVEYGDTGVRTVVTIGPGMGEPAGPVAPGGPRATGPPLLALTTNFAPPTIAGTPEVGRILRARAGEWNSADLDFAYRWRADGRDIPGATGSRYRVTDAEVGATMTLVVTATAGGYSPALAVSSGMRVKAVSKVTLTLNRRTVSAGREITARIRVVSIERGPVDTRQGPISTRPGTGGTEQSYRARAEIGQVVVNVDDRAFTVHLGRGGRATFTLPELQPGLHRVSASWEGTSTVAGDASPMVRVRVR